MNKTNLDKLIKHLKSLPTRWRCKIGFNMTSVIEDRDWCEIDEFVDNSGRNCSQTACIAGHAAILAGVDIHRTLLQHLVIDKALVWLDAKHVDGICGLFLPNRDVNFNSAVPIYDTITLDQAVQTLELFRDTGKVDWSHVEGLL